MAGEKRRPGRPSKYKPEFPEQVAKLCDLGATDREIAEFFEVDLSTINQWKIRYPEFSNSLKTAKEAADERVERSLYHRALGYSHKAVKFHVIDGKVVETPYIEHYPPDTASAIFWLKNRRKDQWRDKRPEDDAASGPNVEIKIIGGLPDDKAD